MKRITPVVFQGEGQMSMSHIFKSCTQDTDQSVWPRTVKCHKHTCYDNNTFWVHLSQKLKFTFVITRCPLLIFHILNFSKLHNGIWGNKTGKKNLWSSTKFMF